MLCNIWIWPSMTLSWSWATVFASLKLTFATSQTVDKNGHVSLIGLGSKHLHYSFHTDIKRSHRINTTQLVNMEQLMEKEAWRCVYCWIGHWVGCGKGMHLEEHNKFPCLAWLAGESIDSRERCCMGLFALLCHCFIAFRDLGKRLIARHSLRHVARRQTFHPEGLSRKGRWGHRNVG